MRHNNAHRKLGRNRAHRQALLKNLSLSLFTHERLQTTLQKAKELRSYAEKIITLAKKDSLHARRMVYARLGNHDLVTKLFDDIAPVYAQRPGGYTRIYRLGERRGDGGQLALIELVDREAKSAKADKPEPKAKGKGAKAAAADGEEAPVKSKKKVARGIAGKAK
jgi:large subunit ribosomal protein L17